MVKGKGNLSDLITNGRRLNSLAVLLAEAIEAEGGDYSNIERIFKTRLLQKRFGQLGTGKLKLADFPCQIYALDLVKNYDVAEDGDLVHFKIPDIFLFSFITADDRRVKGSVVRERAVARHADLSLSDGKYILDHKGEIPVGWRDYKVLFTKTLLCNKDNGGFVMFYLYCENLQWRWGAAGLEDLFDDSYRVPYLPF